VIGNRGSDSPRWLLRAAPVAGIFRSMKTKTRGTAPTARQATPRRGTASSEPTHAQLIRRSVAPAPITGKPVAENFEVRTPWTKVRFKMLAEDAAELRALPPIPFEQLGEDVYMHLWPATLELENGTAWKAGSRTRRIEQGADDWIRGLKGRRLAEMEVRMPARQWQAIQKLAAKLEVPADALILTGLWERLRKLRRYYQERGMTLGAPPATHASGKGGRP